MDIVTFDRTGIFFNLGSFVLPLRYYGLILVTGAFLGGYVASVEARRRGQDAERVWDGIIWALIGGIVGARLWHVVTPPPSMQAIGLTTEYYFSNPIEILMVWKGGLGIPGAVAGGALAVWLFARRYRLPFATWADLAAPGLAMGQAIGRWGNYVNQELFGAPTTLPWGLAIDPAYTTPLGFTDPTLRFHPLFLYESLGNLGICLGLLWLARRFGDKLKPGDVFLAYLVAYPTLRFFLEFLRLDSPLAMGPEFALNINQGLMLVVAILAGAALAFRSRRTRRYQLRAQAG